MNPNFVEEASAIIKQEGSAILCCAIGGNLDPVGKSKKGLQSRCVPLAGLGWALLPCHTLAWRESLCTTIWASLDAVGKSEKGLQSRCVPLAGLGWALLPCHTLAWRKLPAPPFEQAWTRWGRARRGVQHLLLPGAPLVPCGSVRMLAPCCAIGKEGRNG